MRKSYSEQSQLFLGYILENLQTIIYHYHTLTIDDFLAQLAMRIGFHF